MIPGELLEGIFEAASIQRWNDHARPVELTELDKQAHKMVISYVLAKFEEARGVPINWVYLIEGGIFEFLHRLVLTDIKPEVFHKIMGREADRSKLNAWVFKELKRMKIDDLHNGFPQRMADYISSSDSTNVERKILQAAHFLATDWEFRIIYSANRHIFGIEYTKSSIEQQIENHYDLHGVREVMLHRKYFGFIDLCGQLRFQLRWAQSPRIPKTSVLGHMLFVAISSYLCSIEMEACDARKTNNFFAGLFHDLPEVLTRDIISPIKKSTKGLAKRIGQIEKEQVNEKLLPLLPEEWHDEMRYLIEDEFANKIKLVEGGRQKIEKLPNGAIGGYNEDRYSPIDGAAIGACDKLAAYIEASRSILHGITSRHLVTGLKLYDTYANTVIEGVDFGRLFLYFKISR
ncbi:MAG: HD domain-containing protein [Candidatus Aquicultorales bacterium]